MFDWFSRLLSPDAVQESREELAPQHTMLLEQKYKMLSMLDQANDALDRKAATVLQSTAFIIAFISAFKLPDLIGADQPIHVLLFLAGVFVTFIAMVILVILAWRPSPLLVPGFPDWDDQFSKYIYADLEQCFSQILSDILESIKDIRSINAWKGKLVNTSVILLVVQVALLVLTVVMAR